MSLLLKAHETLNATGKSWRLLTGSTPEKATLEASCEIRGKKIHFQCEDTTTDGCVSQFLLHLSKQ